MKRLALYLVLAGLSALAGCTLRSADSSAPAEVLIRSHFAGFEHLRTETNATTLKEIWGLPQTAELKEMALEKIARALASCFVPGTDQAAGDCSALIRPLLNDLLQKECYLEMKNGGNGAPEWVLTVRLEAERLRLWETNCARVFAGWQLKKEFGTNTIAFGTLKSWFAVAYVPRPRSAFSELQATHPILKRIGTEGRPTTAAREYWLKAYADLPRWLARFPMFDAASLPAFDLTLRGKGENVRSEARLVYREPASWHSERWQIPTNTIKDPKGSLMSFTAVQGIAPWLSRQPFVKELGMASAPNQLFAWAQSYALHQLHAALPVAGVTNLIRRVGTQHLGRWNKYLAENAAGQLEVLTTQTGIGWNGLSVVFPHLIAGAEPGRDFLVAGIFPVSPVPTNPPPAELLSELTTRTNLLFYNWEITHYRLRQLRELAKSLTLFLEFRNLPPDSPSSKWLDAVAPKLGNAVTEVSVASARELALMRTSPIGFNGVELLLLALWLDSEEFPRPKLSIGFRPALPLPAKPAP